MKNASGVKTKISIAAILLFAVVVAAVIWIWLYQNEAKAEGERFTGDRISLDVQIYIDGQHVSLNDAQMVCSHEDGEVDIAT